MQFVERLQKGRVCNLHCASMLPVAVVSAGIGCNKGNKPNKRYAIFLSSDLQHPFIGGNKEVFETKDL